jgi:alpha-L-rhamnosidase
VPPAGYLRREFTVTGAVQRAVLHITALGLYECEINGRRIGDHVFAPGWTDYRKRVFFQSYDVTAELRDGANAMGVILGDGWYSGFVAQLDRQFYGDRPRLLAQLEITGTDGRVTCIATDTAWTTSLGPIMENDLLMGETYDACRELGAWSSPGYNASGWSPAVCAPDPGIAIERSPGPPVRRMETLAPVGVRQGATLPGDPGPLRIFDLGQNIAGRVRLRVTAPRGTRLTIRHAEMLAPDGNLYTEFLRTAKATDTYTCGGGGEEQM